MCIDFRALGVFHGCRKLAYGQLCHVNNTYVVMKIGQCDLLFTEALLATGSSFKFAKCCQLGSGGRRIYRWLFGVQEVFLSNATNRAKVGVDNWWLTLSEML